IPLTSRTRATFRRAELGFLGVVVYTRVQTPRFCGAPLRAGVLVRLDCSCRPLRINWLIVGTDAPRLLLAHALVENSQKKLPAPFGRMPTARLQGPARPRSI